MRHMTQPDNKTCGQTCIAMVAGVTVAEVIERTRVCGCMNTRKLINALRLFGFDIGQNRLSRGQPKHPARAICKMRFKLPDGRWQRNWHWVLIWNGRWYDPAGPHHRHKLPWEISSHLRLD